MRVEKYKSIILSLLVLVSIFLTWRIWSYQPDYEESRDQSSQYIQVTTKDKQEVEGIIRPTEVIYHKNNQHYVTSSELEISKVMKEITKWSYANFYDISSQVSEDEFLDFVHGDGKTEIIFPEKVPLYLYNSVLQIEERNLPKGSFDRIIFNVNSKRNNQVYVYFISYADRKIYQCRVNSDNIDRFEQNTYRFASALYGDSAYEKHIIAKGRAVFLPGKNLSVPRFTYKTLDLEIERFKSTLFNDPNYVKKTRVTRGEEYTEEFTDGFRLLNIYWDTMTMSYVNPTKETSYDGSPSQLIRNSLEFVNEHAGWDDSYRYAGFNPLDQKITYRMYINGMPVFNESGMSEIVQFWGQENVFQYSRPIFTLDFPIPIDDAKVKMPGGSEVLQELQAVKNIKSELIQDIKIGYELKRNTEADNLVGLEPAWYYRYAGVWKKVPFGKPGGDIIGLEQN
ncbi:YycH family regulatory protein [Peribacillus sp. SCS-37]|uniref:YycH family regulatory protein n=1 Tax=Paraperibacillus esterisolvens TaxID=3115296 RepID=UPI0039057BD5